MVTFETGVLEAVGIVPTVAFTAKELKLCEGVLKGTTMRIELVDLKCSTVLDDMLGRVEGSVLEDTGTCDVVYQVVFVELLMG